MLSLFRPRSPIPPTPTAATSTTTALDDALKSFQDCLDPEQKAKLEAIKAVPDAHAVAEFTHQLDHENAKRKSRCVAARISPLLESIQQFSGVVETFVSSHPQVAALIWGSMKLVLQIASNFTTYFDKLSALLMTIGKRCPKFQEYQKLYGSSSDLQKALCDFYSVVVRCCEQAITAIRRPGYAQLLKAMTGSFNSEFEPILIQIEQSSGEVKETICLLEAKSSATERQDQHLERDEAHQYRLGSIVHRKERQVAEANRLAQKQLARQRIRQASKLEQLSNFNNRIAYSKIRMQRHGSTGQWLTQTDQFQQWIGGGSPSVFWCTGNLGSGKTVMTGYVVELLSAKYSQSTEKLVYFFCQYDNESSLQVTTILQSIIRQLLDQDDDRFTANESSIDALLDNPHNLSSSINLLADITDSLKSVVVILDGVDECSLTEMKLLLKTLRSLMLRQSPGLKLYLAGDSRITHLIESSLNPKFVLSTRVPEARSDLKELVQQLVEARREDEDLVVGDPDLYQVIVDVLFTASQGMILWVKFQLEELCAQKTDESIRLTLKHLPKDIFETYNRLLSKIVEEGSVEICNRIFWYIATAKRPFTVDELGEAVSIEPCQPCFMPKSLVNNTRGIIRWCHGLVALHDLDDALQFTHSSVKEFFCSPDTEEVILRGFHFRPCEADRKLGEVCITYLDFDDFKTQLVKPPKPGALLYLDPLILASHTLRTGPSSIVLNRAKDLMRKRSKSTSATQGLLLPQTNQAVTRDYKFLNYASEFWLSHTTKFSPEQDRVWSIFLKLAEARYLVLSEADTITSLYPPDKQIRPSRDYMFIHQHQGLFLQWMARHWNKKDLSVILTLVLRWQCYSFVQLLPPLAEQSRSSWQEAVLSLEPQTLAPIIYDAGSEWLKKLTTPERSTLLAKLNLIEDDFVPVTSRLELIRLGIDPYHEYNTRGKTITLLERLICDMDVKPLEIACANMAASGISFRRKIADRGRTALHVAASFQRVEAILVLLKYGASINTTDWDGCTALHIAAKEFELDPSATVALLRAGASSGMKDLSGRLALDYVTESVRVVLLRAINRSQISDLFWESASDRPG